MKWKCLIFDKYNTLHSKTTGNIRDHLNNHHKELALLLKAKKGESSLNLTNTSSAISLSQSHLDKKAKIIQFTTDGLMKILVKYSILTNQSFLSVEHPIFFELLDYCRPGIKLPKRQLLKTKIIETFYSRGLH